MDIAVYYGDIGRKALSLAVCFVFSYCLRSSKVCPLKNENIINKPQRHKSSRLLVEIEGVIIRVF